MKPIKGLRVTLISDVLYAPYSGMLPGYLGGFYDFDDIHFDLIKVAARSGAHFVHGRVEKILPREGRLLLPDGRSLSYDFLSINVGCVPTVEGDIDESAILPLKPISGFLEGWRSLLASIKQMSSAPQLAVVGAGAAGFEVALILQRELRKVFPKSQVTVVDGADRILATQPKALIEELEKIAAKENVQVITGARVMRFRNKILDLSTGQALPVDFALWATGAAPPQVLINSGDFQTDNRGFLKVDTNLQVLGFDNIFAAGDGIAFPTPLPKAGVYAVRQGPTLEHNLRAALLGSPLQRYHPQKSALALITAGAKIAFASKKYYLGKGNWLWRLKDKIDRDFMIKWQTYPAMTEPRSYADAIPTSHIPNDCGGCASKVSPQVILPIVLKNDRPVEDAAPIIHGNGQLYETVDLIPSLISDPFIFGRIATLHCLSDLYAMGAKPVSAQVILQIQSSPAAIQQRDLSALMAGVTKELEKAKIPLVGGHTGIGGQMQIGFAMCGEATQPITKKGAKPGDAIIVTKALGSGTLLRALMMGQLAARDYEVLIDSLLQSNQIALDLAAKFPINAMTDITGFGLAGHLLEVLQQSKCGATITTASLPILPGFKSAAGMVTPVLRREIAHHLLNSGTIIGSLPEPCSDPQTSGGLLLTVPQNVGSEILEFLQTKGFEKAAMIGTILPGEPGRIEFK